MAVDDDADDDDDGVSGVPPGDVLECVDPVGDLRRCCCECALRWWCDDSDVLLPLPDDRWRDDELLPL